MTTTYPGRVAADDNRTKLQMLTEGALAAHELAGHLPPDIDLISIDIPWPSTRTPGWTRWEELRIVAYGLQEGLRIVGAVPVVFTHSLNVAANGAVHHDWTAEWRNLLVQVSAIWEPPADGGAS